MADFFNTSGTGSHPSYTEIKADKRSLLLLLVWVVIKHCNIQHTSDSNPRGGSTLGQGGSCPPNSLVVPPDSKASWLFYVISVSEFPKCSKIQIFQGSAPDSTKVAHSSKSPSWLGRGSLPLSQEPHLCSRPFGPHFYRSHGLTHYRLGNPTNDRSIWSSYFFLFQRMEKMDSMMKRLMG